MFCQSCGSQLPDNAQFCMYCGHKTHTGSQNNSAVRPKKSVPSGKKTGLIILICMLLAALILVPAAWLLLSYVPAHRTVAQIPDPEEYFNLTCSERRSSDTNGTVTYTFTSADPHTDILEEYVDLLESGHYDFRLFKEEYPTQTYSGDSAEDLYDSIYGFRYSGGEKLGESTLYTIYIRHRGTGTRYCKGGTVEWNESTTEIIIRNMNNFEFISAGTYIPTPASSDDPGTGSAEESSEEDSDIDLFKKDPCWTCGNDGRCDTCGGSGWVNTWTGDGYVTQNCTAAFCRSGSCSECDGRGYK